MRELNSKNGDGNISLIKVRGDTIEIPVELDEYLHNSNRFFVLEKSDEIWIRKLSASVFLKMCVRGILAAFSKNKYHFSIAGRIADHTFRFKPGSDLTGEYKLANYENDLLLISGMQSGEHAARQQVWGSIKNYHEHRPVSDQEANAWRVSKFLADQIIEQSPKSVLEFGCGAGRNLICLKEKQNAIKVSGFDINKAAIEVGRQQNPSLLLETRSIYETHDIPDAAFDVVFTSGVLMHIPHEKVSSVIHEMHRIAKNCVLHFELHGPSHNFDCHRYPRDYALMYRKNGFEKFNYSIYPKSDYRSKVSGFVHALLTYVKQH